MKTKFPVEPPVKSWLVSRVCLPLLACACAAASIVSSHAAEPIIRYTFDDGTGNAPATDSGTAPGLNGSFVGAATRTANTPNGTGYALDLNGADGAGHYVQAEDAEKLNNLTNLTITCWVNLRGNPKQNDRIVDKLAVTPQAGFGFMFNNASATAPQLLLLVNGNAAAGAIPAVGGTYVYPPSFSNTWVFVAVTYDGSAFGSTVNFYTGGTNSSVSRLGDVLNYVRGPILNTTNPLRVGSTPASTADRTAPIWLDDVRVYNTVLTAEEIEAIRAENSPPPGEPSFLSEPVDLVASEGTQVSFSSTAGGQPPLSYQWLFNGTTVIPGATNSTLTLSPVTLAGQGSYQVRVTNAYGEAVSDPAHLTVRPFLFNTGKMTNIWNLESGSRPYITGSYNNRTLAYNHVTTNLLVVSPSAGGVVSVAILDPETGSEKGFLNTTGVGGGTLPLDAIAVAEDGVIYASSLTTSAVAGLADFYIWRWSNDTDGWAPDFVFAGNPAEGVETNRWGDAMAVRGAGADTRILLAPGSGTNVVLLRTMDGYDFQYAVSPAVIAVSGVPSGFAMQGIAFGPQTNTFWAKTAGGRLYLIQFDPDTKTGSVLHSYRGADLLRGISVDAAQQHLAGVAGDPLGLGDRACLYDISDLEASPVLLDQEPFLTANANTLFGGLAATAFGGDYLFALDSNNGIKAFRIDPNYSGTVQPPTSPLPLLLDLGPTLTSYVDATNDVVHASSALAASNAFWNTLSTDSGDLLAYADGTPATGVNVNLGRGVSAGVVNLEDNGFFAAPLGGARNTGIYAGTSPARDGAVPGNPGEAFNIGLRIDGLLAGGYTVYFTGVNGNNVLETPERFFCAAGPPASTFTFDTNATAWADVANTPANQGAFVKGDNYNVLSATLAPGDSLYLAASGISTNEVRGFLNSVAILPGLPASTSFRISNVAIQDDAAIITWESVAGKSYHVQSSPSLNSPVWSDASGAIMASGATTSFTNSLSGAAARFYRVQVEP